MSIDHHIREKIQYDLDNTYMVEAGAGTGKTTLLVARILELIKSGKASLAQIVAITFTEKAAAELKTRIQQKLEECIENYHGEEYDRLAEASANIERAGITTIHGFCANILRERPVEAGIDPAFIVADESMRNMFYRKLWRRWVWQQLQEKESFLSELLHLGVTVENLAGIAERLTQNRDSMEQWMAMDLYSINLASLAQHFDRTIDRLDELQLNCRDHSDRGYIANVRLIKLWKFLKERETKNLERRLLQGIPISVEGNQKNWRPAASLKEIKQLLQSLREKYNEERLKLIHNFTCRSLTWLANFVQYYQSQKKFLDFEDLLLCTRNMLKSNKKVRSILQQNYHYILVDEFQDTDPLQVEILFFLGEKETEADIWQSVEIEPGKLFIVGDPKQSIYRFRRADIEIYEEVKRKIGNCVSITQNFRCRPGIIEWANKVFAKLIQPPKDGHYQPEYHPLHASRSSSIEGKEVVFLSHPAMNKDLRMADIMECESFAIAYAIHLMIKEKWPVEEKGQLRPMRYADTAILMRRFSHLEVFEKTLQSYQIPYQIIGSKSFFTRIEVKSMASLLRSLLDPYNTISLIATLRSPIFSISDEEIFHYCRQATLDYRKITTNDHYLVKVLQILNELHNSAKQLSLPIFIEQVLQKTGIVFTFLQMTQGEQMVANIMKFLELSHSLKTIEVYDFRSFVHWITEMEQTEQEEAESYLHEQETDAVHIFSIHRSKGLEFPAVFLGDLAAAPRHTSDILLERVSGKASVRIGGRLHLQTADYEQQAESEKKRMEAEEKRLLYVAMTRAKEYLIIPTIAQGHGYLKFLSPFLPKSTIEKPYHMIEAPLKNPSSSKVEQKSSENRFVDIEDRQKKREEVLSAATAVKPLLSLPQNQDVFWKRIYDILEHIEPLAGNDMFLLYDIDNFIRKEISLNDQEKKLAEQILRKVVVSAPLIRAQNSGRLYRSLPFAYDTGQEIIPGSIDLCFRDHNEFVVMHYLSKQADNPRKEAMQHLSDGMLSALALREIARRQVKEIVFFFLPSCHAVSFSITDDQLKEFRRQLIKNGATQVLSHFSGA